MVSKNNEKRQACYGDNHLVQMVGKGMKRILAAQLSQKVQGKHTSGKGKQWGENLKDTQA